MSYLIRERALIAQPVDAGTLRKSGSLARGLIAALLPTPRGYIDAGRFHNNAFAKVGAPVWVPIGPKRGGGYSFGSGNALVGGSLMPAFVDSFSIALWINFDPMALSYSQILTRDAGAGTDWAIAAAAGVHTPMWSWSGGVSLSGTSTPGGWNFWHFSVNAALQGFVCLNGVIDTALTGGIPTRTADGPIRMGQRTDGYGCDALLGRAYIWNRATTPEEAARLARDEWQLFESVQEWLWVPPAGGGSAIKNVSGLAIASVKSISGLAIASVKNRSGLA